MLYFKLGDIQLMHFHHRDFTVLDETTTKNILSQNFRLKNFPNGKKMFLCVGARGSGKSTVIANMYKQNMLDVPYISSEIFLHKNLLAINNPHRTELSKKASQIVTSNLIKSGCSFCLETELASQETFEAIFNAKKNGYKICVCYVMTDNPEINLARVDNLAINRQSEIIHAHNAFKNRVVKLIEICDELFMFDNSKNLTQTKDNNMVLE